MANWFSCVQVSQYRFGVLRSRDPWIRIGDFRVLYEIQDNVLTVTVVRVAHRREVYKTDPHLSRCNASEVEQTIIDKHAAETE